MPKKLLTYYNLSLLIGKGYRGYLRGDCPFFRRWFCFPPSHPIEVSPLSIIFMGVGKESFRSRAYEGGWVWEEDAG
jgi:hypothetical protein